MNIWKDDYMDGDKIDLGLRHQEKTTKSDDYENLRTTRKRRIRSRTEQGLQPTITTRGRNEYQSSTRLRPPDSLIKVTTSRLDLKNYYLQNSEFWRYGWTIVSKQCVAHDPLHDGGKRCFWTHDAGKTLIACVRVCASWKHVFKLLRNGGGTA